MDGVRDDRPENITGVVRNRPESIPAGSGELAYRLHQQQLLARFGLFALQAATLDEIMDRATRISAEGLNVELSKFLEYQPESDRLLVRAGIGWKDGVVGAVTLNTDMASPAGYAFAAGQAVLSNHLAGESRFRIPALLLDHGVRRALNVPVKGASTMYGILEADSTSDLRFSDPDFAFLQGVANILAAAIDHRGKARELEDALTRETLLASEMRHRVKNLFAVVTTMISICRREANEVPEAIDLLADRVAALTRASEAGLGEPESHSEDETFDPVLMTRLVLAPYGERVTVSGDAAMLRGAERTTLALVLHELATNAVKYGALSTETGSVCVLWNADDDGAGFTWTERGGPKVLKPRTEGFGQRLIARLLKASGGGIRYTWDTSGLIAQVRLS